MGGTQPVGYMDLYVLLPNPVLVFIPLSMLMSLFLMVLVGSLEINFIGILIK